MRVLQLGPFPPPHGGVQSNLVAIRGFLRQRNISCAVINITGNRKPDADEVYYPRTSFELLRLLNHLDYDILHLHLGGRLSGRLLGLSLVCCLLPHSKTVLTFHSGGFPLSRQGKGLSAQSLTAFVLRRFDKLIGVNSVIVDFFQRLGVPAERITLISPHSFPGTSPSSNGDTPEKLPREIARFIDHHSPVLISVGLLEKEYDLPIQIAVLERVLKVFPTAGLLMIGSGSMEGELRDIIAAKSYAADILLCGDTPHKATLGAILRSDVMLRTTFYDGDAVSVREALYMGIPVIATDNGMRPEGVRLIPTSDLDALATTIEEVLRAQDGKGAVVPIADETNIEAVYRVYQELTAGD